MARNIPPGADPVSSTETAPRDAYEAAQRLRAQGHHVDVVADGQRYCPAGTCPKERP